MFTLLLHQDILVDPRVHADLVAKHLGLSRLEAKMLVRRGRGIFLEDLPEEAARAIAAHLMEAGIRVETVSQSELPPTPNPQRISRADRGSKGFSFCIARSDETGTVDWERVGFVSLGLVARAEARQEAIPRALQSLPAMHKISSQDRSILRENLIRRMGHAGSAPEISSRTSSVFQRLDARRDFGVVLDVLPEDLSRWLRVVLDEFGYIPTEGSVQLGPPWGLESFVEDLRLRCAASLTDLSVDILKGEDFSPLIFSGLEELNRYTRWSILRRRLGLEPEIPWAEPDLASHESDPGNCNPPSKQV